MVDRVPFKLFEPYTDVIGNERLVYVGALAQADDVAYLVSFRPTGTQIRWGMRPVVRGVDRVLYTVTDDQQRDSTPTIIKQLRRAILARRLLSDETDEQTRQMLGNVTRGSS